MNRIVYFFLFLIAVGGFVSCNNDETYAEQKEAERDAINRYISRHGIRVISESDFEAKGYVTDTASNEYVLFSNTGVYMQIINAGCGEKIKAGESATVLCRFYEYNIKGDSVQLSNMSFTTNYLVETMEVTKKSGSFYASFNTEKGSLMNSKYGSTSVPAGWLVPLSYVKLGRLEKDGDEIAHVRIIVPHNQGQTNASSYVYPCMYDISYQRGV